MVSEGSKQTKSAHKVVGHSCVILVRLWSWCSALSIRRQICQENCQTLFSGL